MLRNAATIAVAVSLVGWYRGGMGIITQETAAALANAHLEIARASDLITHIACDLGNDSFFRVTVGQGSVEREIVAVSAQLARRIIAGYIADKHSEVLELTAKARGEMDGEADHG